MSNIKWRPIPTYGDHMLLQQFVETCKRGGFTDDDGHGYYSTLTQLSNIPANPSTIDLGRPNNSSFTHVVWFNK